MRIRRMMGIPILIALVMTFSFGCAPTQKQATPKAEMQAKNQKAKAWQFHDIVDVSFVQPFVKIPSPKDVILIDSRPTRKKFDNGHIPTAINIPNSKFDKMTGLLPANKEALLIFYCQGPT